MKRTYEILVYQTSSDYEGRNFNEAETGITNKKTAIKIGKSYLDDNYQVKVQSNDREFIQLLSKEV